MKKEDAFVFPYESSLKMLSYSTATSFTNSGGVATMTEMAESGEFAL